MLITIIQARALRCLCENDYYHDGVHDERFEIRVLMVGGQINPVGKATSNSELVRI